MIFIFFSSHFRGNKLIRRLEFVLHRKNAYSNYVWFLGIFTEKKITRSRKKKWKTLKKCLRKLWSSKSSLIKKMRKNSFNFRKKTKKESLKNEGKQQLQKENEERILKNEEKQQRFFLELRKEEALFKSKSNNQRTTIFSQNAVWNAFETFSCAQD